MRVAALWRGAPGEKAAETRNYARLEPILSALLDAGVDVELLLYTDANSNAIAEKLVQFEGVLVWVDPISPDGDRSVLDEVLRDVALRGTWVSTHPDTISKMGTKEVLHRTRSMGWGGDTRLYSTVEQLRSEFAHVLTSGRPRVLKQLQGNGGIGVWKVEALDPEAQHVRVQHAAPRDDATEDLPLVEFIDRFERYLVGSGKLIDQPFASRLSEGMIRAYLVESEVVGFARQQPISREVDPSAPAADRVLGMPSAKTMYDADEPEFAALRARLEAEWVPELVRVVGLDVDDLPIIWDADFLYGPRTDDGLDTYMLCEINVSSVIPFPAGVPSKVAASVRRRAKEHS
jgi:hypothetical protein